MVFLFLLLADWFDFHIHHAYFYRYPCGLLQHPYVDQCHHIVYDDQHLWYTHPGDNTRQVWSPAHVFWHHVCIWKHYAFLLICHCTWRWSRNYEGHAIFQAIPKYYLNQRIAIDSKNGLSTKMIIIDDLAQIIVSPNRTAKFGTDMVNQ